MKIKKGDNVIVNLGKDKGKQGAVLEVLRDKDSVIVEGVNMRKKFQKSNESGKEGKITEIAYPIHISNVSVYDEKAKKGSRIGAKIDDKGKKVRVLRASGTELK